MAAGNPMRTPPAILSTADRSPPPRSSVCSRGWLIAITLLLAAGTQPLLLSVVARAAPSAQPQRTPAPVLTPLPVQSVVPLPVRPVHTPAPSVEEPAPVPAAVPAPGSVAGVASPPKPPAAVATPALLAPVASLPGPSTSLHDTSPAPWIAALFAFMVILLASTILLARRRL